MMKVAVISGSTFSCPPISYGSEITTWWLAEELDRAGCEVHLIAPGGSRKPPNGYLHYIPCSQGIVSLEDDIKAWEWYGDIIASCDIVHDLSPTCATIERIFLESPETPYLYTRNGIDFTRPRLGKKNAVVLSEVARTHALNGWSAWHQTPYRKLGLFPGILDEARVVHYGVDVDFYYKGGSKDDYVLYCGRPHLSKGVKQILQVAKLMPGQKFKLAWHPILPDHFRFDRIYKRMAREWELENVEFVDLPLGFGHHEAKRELYQKAKCFIQLTQYTEAFGLTAIESLACGTPVILMNKGSAPEIVNEKNGVLVNSVGEAVEAVRSIEKVKPEDCVEDARGCWSKERMCRDYLKIYSEILRAEKYLKSYSEVLHT